MTAAAYSVPKHRYDALDLRDDAHLLDLRNRTEAYDATWDAQPRVQGARVSTYAPVVREEGLTLGDFVNRPSVADMADRRQAE